MELTIIRESIPTGKLHASVVLLVVCMWAVCDNMRVVDESSRLQCHLAH